MVRRATADAGGTPEPDRLTGPMTGTLEVDAETVAAAIDTLIASGMLTGTGTRPVLTTSGHALRGDIRAGTAETTAGPART